MPSTQEVVVTVTPAHSTALTGSTNADAESTAFLPQLGRDMYLTLSGTWAGSVQVQRSTDGGTTWNNITIGGGQPWGLYTANCDEVVDTPTDGAATYRLDITITSGTLAYRLAQ